MSFAPNDLVTDADLVAYERNILSQHGSVSWQTRRQKAIEDWLFPLMEGRGFAPQQLRTRYAPAIVYADTSSVTSDITTAAATADGVVISTRLPTATDYLCIGYPTPFRGVSLRMTGTVNAAAAVLTVATWADTWLSRAGSDLQDGTMVSGKSLARGGAVTWTMPEGPVARSLYGVGPYYWARVGVSAAMTSGTAIGPVSVIRRSRLCAPVALRTLALIMREAPAAQDGPWADKAEWYEAEAEKAWLRVADQIGPEFDTNADDVINASELQQTSAQVSGGGWSLERG